MPISNGTKNARARVHRGDYRNDSQDADGYGQARYSRQASFADRGCNQCMGWDGGDIRVTNGRAGQTGGFDHCCGAAVGSANIHCAAWPHVIF